MKTHILCLGDSNTHGYCADPNDCADHGIRFNEEERWTCRLQKALGDEYLVTEEGLSGRTTVFVDPIHESMDALSVIYALLKSHEVCQELGMSRCHPSCRLWKDPEQGYELDGRCGAHGSDKQCFLYALSAGEKKHDCDR